MEFLAEAVGLLEPGAVVSVEAPPTSSPSSETGGAGVAFDGDLFPGEGSAGLFGDGGPPPGAEGFGGGGGFHVDDLSVLSSRSDYCGPPHLASSSRGGGKFGSGGGLAHLHHGPSSNSTTSCGSLRTLPTVISAGSATCAGGGGGDNNGGESASSSSSVRSAKSESALPLRRSQSSRSVLARRVVKKLPNGDLFSGLVDAVTGELVHGRRTYVGTGEVFEGYFGPGGTRHGDGAVSTQADGSKFLGSFRHDAPCEGTLITSSHTYQGRLLAPKSVSSTSLGSGSCGGGQKEGAQSSSSGPPPAAASRAIFHGRGGTLVQKNGDVYEGDFSHGKYHGRGRERTSSGLNYKGRFRNGKWHGDGQLTVERRSKDIGGGGGIHSNGGSMALPFNPEAFRYTYSGQWQFGEREGQGSEKVILGRLLSTKGSDAADPSSSAKKRRDEASIQQHDREEQKKCQLRRTATFRGKFHRDRRHGLGELRLPDGTLAEGPWKGGVPDVDREDDDDADCGNSATSPSLACDEGSSANSGPIVGSLIGLSGAAGRRARRRMSSSSRRRRANQRPTWKIEYPNGDRYHGEVALSPSPFALAAAANQRSASSENNRKEGGSAAVDPMRAHLHLNFSLLLPVVPDGRGTMASSSTGDVFTGHFRRGRRHGPGRCVYGRTGEHHDGTWVDGMPGVVGGRSLRLFEPYFEYPTRAADESASSHGDGGAPEEDAKGATREKKIESEDIAEVLDSGTTRSDRDVTGISNSAVDRKASDAAAAYAAASAAIADDGDEVEGEDDDEAVARKRPDVSEGSIERSAVNVTEEENSHSQHNGNESSRENKEVESSPPIDVEGIIHADKSLLKTLSDLQVDGEQDASTPPRAEVMERRGKGEQDARGKDSK